MKIIRYPGEDFPTLVFLCVYLTSQIIGIVAGSLWAICAIPFVAWWLKPAALIQHNHVHLPIFHGKWLNELLSIALFFGCGVPHEVYFVHHVRGHHRATNDPERDPSSIFAFLGTRYPDIPVSKWRYVATFPWRAITWSVREIRSERTSRSRRARFYRSLIIVGAIVLWAGIQHPIGTAVFVGLPWVATWFGLASNNYRHHVGCDMQGTWRSANNDFSAYGLIHFQVGCHAAHHARPSMHWSRLLGYTLQHYPLIPPEYVRREK